MQTLFATSLLLTVPAMGQALSTSTSLDLDSGHARSQIKEPTLPADVLRTLGRSLVVDDVGGGTLWAAGPSWKASFGPDGFTYIPFLGSDAPRNFPIQFALESVTVDGEPLMFEREAAASQVADRTISLDRSTVREVYHLSEDAVEQTFVFDALPRTGDVVIRMAVESELRTEADGAGFAFVGERGGVRYGSATGIAATGDRMQLQQCFVDGGLEIRVSAGDLTAESFPFVVDPILTTLGVTGDSRDQVDVDVAFDANTGVYMIVYEEVQSIQDHDVRTVFYNTNVELFLNASTIDITSENWREPRVANSLEDSLFLCVATRGALVGVRDIWGRTRDAGTGARGAPFAISTFPGDNAHADVGGFGGDFNTSFPFLVVWENYLSVPDDHDIYGQAVGVNSELQGPLRAIADSPTDDDRYPSISQNSGRRTLSSGDQEYVVAWQREVSVGDNDIWTRVADYTGSLAGHDAWRSYSFGDSRNVTVSSQYRSFPDYEGEAIYVLAFERLRSGIYELFTVVTREGNPDNARSVTEMQDIAVGRHHANPKIAQDGTGDYMIAYKSAAPGGGFDAHMTAVNVVADGNELRTAVAERRDSFVHAPGQAGAVAIASTYDGGQLFLDSRAMALYTAPGAGGDEEVSAAIVVEQSGQVDGSQFCEANDNASGLSAWIRAGGTGNDPSGTLHVAVQDLPLNAFGYVMASLDTGFTANPGGSAGNLCLAGAIGRLVGQVQSSGSTGTVGVAVDLSNLPQPTGSVPALSGERWKFQYWTRDVLGGMVTSNFSNAVVVDFK